MLFKKMNNDQIIILQQCYEKSCKIYNLLSAFDKMNDNLFLSSKTNDNLAHLGGSYYKTDKSYEIS